MSTKLVRAGGLLGLLLTCCLALACSGASDPAAPSGPTTMGTMGTMGTTAELPAHAGEAPPIDVRHAGPPAAEIEWPAEASSHNTVRLDVRGSARGVEQVFVNGHGVPVDGDGRWTADVELPEGRAEIVVHAPLQGEGEPERLALRAIVVDLEAPVMVLAEAPGSALDTPPGARLVGATSIELVGRVDDAPPGRPDTLTLDERPCELGEDGGFRVAVELAVEGENRLRLVAEDAAGNRARLALVVVRDTLPPTLEVTPPTAAELERTGERMRVHGRVVDAHPARLTADGAPVELAGDGSFELELETASLPRTLELVAEDAAGNRSEPLRLELARDG